jgi:ribonuclease HI
MQGITSWINNWKKNNWKNLQKKMLKIKIFGLNLDKYVSKHNVKWNWVKGHSGHEKNEIADLLANKGIDNI